jgi:hypothetical protein
VDELERLTGEFFAAVSFEPGERPNYEAIRALFIPAGLLIRNAGDVPEVMSVDEFIALRAALVESGALTSFYESSSGRSTRSPTRSAASRTERRSRHGARRVSDELDGVGRRALRPSRMRSGRW